jgi:hypothetical protein
MDNEKLKNTHMKELQKEYAKNVLYQRRREKTALLSRTLLLLSIIINSMTQKKMLLGYACY